jgi:hypothetical protein
MMINIRMAHAILAAALSLYLGNIPAASAEDPMQQDTTFRDTISQGRDGRGQREERRVQRYEKRRDVRGRAEAEKRHVRGHNEEGR